VETDWIVGYGPPAEKFHEKIIRILAGEGTFKALSAAYAKNPKDVPTVFGLARKYGDRYNLKKSSELYKAVIALDPQGRAGTYKLEYDKIEVPYTEYAEFALGADLIYSDSPDPAPLQAFLKKYPATKLDKQVYQRLSYFYGYQAPKDKAGEFFAEYAARFPDDPDVLNMWLTRVVRDKEPLEKGGELAAALEKMSERHAVRAFNETMAQFYALKGEKAKVAEIYGKDFMGGQVSSLAYDLLDYASFWAGQGANTEDALAMADLALKLKPDQTYVTQQVAGVYLKAGQEAKALEIFGPAWLQKNSDKANNFVSYASFWSNQGKNLDGALAAAIKAVEMKPDTYYMWSTLSNVHLKMKAYDEALAAAQKAIDKADNEQVKEFLKKSLDRIKAAKEKDAKK